MSTSPAERPPHDGSGAPDFSPPAESRGHDAHSDLERIARHVPWMRKPAPPRQRPTRPPIRVGFDLQNVNERLATFESQVRHAEKTARVAGSRAVMARSTVSRRLPAGAPAPRRTAARRASGLRAGQDPGEDGEPGEPPAAPASPGAASDLKTVAPDPAERSRALAGPSPRFSRPWRPQTEALVAALFEKATPAADGPAFEQLSFLHTKSLSSTSRNAA